MKNITNLTNKSTLLQKNDDFLQIHKCMNRKM